MKNTIHRNTTNIKATFINGPEEAIVMLHKRPSGWVGYNVLTGSKFAVTANQIRNCFNILEQWYQEVPMNY